MFEQLFDMSENFAKKMSHEEICKSKKMKEKKNILTINSHLNPLNRIFLILITEASMCR